MSKTYRRCQLELDCNCGAPYKEPEEWSIGCYWGYSSNWYFRHGLIPERTCNCGSSNYNGGSKWDYYSKRNLKRDRKNDSKPNKVNKIIGKRRRRAIVRNFMVHENYDNIPKFKMTDRWDWA